MNIQTSEKRKKLLLPLIIIFAAILSFYIQQSNFFYKGDELGNIAVFFLSFLFLTIGISFFFRENTIAIVNTKTICGLILLILDITSISTFFGTVVFKHMTGPIFIIISLFVFSLFNLFYLIYSRFWAIHYSPKYTNITSFINIFFILTIFMYFIRFVNKINHNIDLDDSTIMLLLVIMSIPLINIIYSTFLIKLHKKDKLRK